MVDTIRERAGTSMVGTSPSFSDPGYPLPYLEVDTPSYHYI